MDATEIIPNLWMGGNLESPLMPGSGFDAILDLRLMQDILFFQAAPKVFAWVPMVDGALPSDMMPIIVATNMAFGWLWSYSPDTPSNVRPWKVLIHCAEGHNRSGLITALVLCRCMKPGTYANFTPQEAIDLIRSKRPKALENQDFVNYILSQEGK